MLPVDHVETLLANKARQVAACQIVRLIATTRVWVGQRGVYGKGAAEGEMMANHPICAIRPGRSP